MHSTGKVSALLCGLGILLAPAVVQSAVVYRTTGVACTPEVPGEGVTSYSAEAGLEYAWGAAPLIACSIPTSDETFDTTTLTQVNVRYYFDGAAVVTGRLLLHDHDSPDWVECGEDVDNVTATGHHVLEMPNGCSGLSYASNWGVVATVETSGMSATERLNVKLVSVQR